jgi:glycyl-tRNA synthetase beta subunit
MAILVKHRKTGNEYILLKIDTIGSKSSIPVRLLEDFFAKNEAEITNLATICDVKGNIFVVSIDNLIVTEIDGRKPNEILPEIVVPSVSEEPFPEDDLEEQPEASFSRKIHSTDNRDNLDEELEEDEDWI